MTPGAGRLSFDAYKAIEATNWTSLKHLRESPLKYRHMQTAEDEDNVARAVGRAAHCALFEPDEFDGMFFVLPEDAPRRPSSIQRNAKKPSPETVEAIRWWDEFNAAAVGKTMLTDEQWRQAVGIATAVRAHPLVAPYLTDGEFEVPLTWTDPDTGERCKARLDWWSRSKRALIDLKTTTSIDAFMFGRIAARLGYHCQAGHYYNGVRYGLNRMCEEVAIVAVEAKAPHDVAIFGVDDAALVAGQEEVAVLIRKLQECRRTSTWPGRYTEKQSLLLPQHIYGDEEIAVTEEA